MDCNRFCIYLLIAVLVFLRVNLPFYWVYNIILNHAYQVVSLYQGNSKSLIFVTFEDSAIFCFCCRQNVLLETNYIFYYMCWFSKMISRLNANMWTGINSKIRYSIKECTKEQQSQNENLLDSLSNLFKNWCDLMK